jgi:hypothetical protein
MTSISTTTKTTILALVAAIIIIATGFIDRIPQDPQYHQFADQRSFFDIPNTLNVASNLFFALIGIAGLFHLCLRRSLAIVQSLFSVYVLFFTALVAIAPGSAYYHWNPDNQSLAWDRLPMTLVFMSFFTIIIGERLSPRVAKFIFLPLLILGTWSIIYWHQSELAGYGDLRPYGLVQYLPMLLIPLILLIFEARFSSDRAIWWFCGFYLIAKGFEVLDHQIFDFLAIISGHSLKHLVASIACLIYLGYLRYRTALDPESQYH